MYYNRIQTLKCVVFCICQMATVSMTTLIYIFFVVTALSIILMVSPNFKDDKN